MSTETAILLTGGTGFFGKALLRYLVSTGRTNGCKIFVLSRHPEKFQVEHSGLVASERIFFLRGDIQDRASLPWTFSFSHVLHAATDSTLGPSLPPLHRFNCIVQGTSNVLDLAVATGASRFLLTSSGGVYGQQPGDLAAITEDWQGAPLLSDPGTAYSQAKRAAEHLCALYRDAYGLHTVIARCFAFVGPDLPLNAHYAIGNFIRDALTAEAVTVFGDGTPLRTYLDQGDLAHWLWTLLLEGIDGETYNVGSDQVVSIAELAHLVRRLLAPTKPVRIVGIAQPLGGRNRYVPNIQKIIAMHGLSVAVPLDQSILNTAKAHDAGDTYD